MRNDSAFVGLIAVMAMGGALVGLLCGVLVDLVLL